MVICICKPAIENRSQVLDIPNPSSVEWVCIVDAVNVLDGGNEINAASRY
jgi:hypothetical protein